MTCGAAGRVLSRLDSVLGFLGHAFRKVAIGCLFLMLLATAITIALRPFDVAYYWIWPWTMILFVWMTFFGLFAVYRFRKDIVIDIIVRRTPEPASTALRVLPPLVILFVSVAVLLQIPSLIAVQGGPIDGALLPGGGELSRLFLTVPMALSFALVAAQSALDLLLVRSVGAAVTEAAQVGEP